MNLRNMASEVSETDDLDDWIMDDEDMENLNETIVGESSDTKMEDTPDVEQANNPNKHATKDEQFRGIRCGVCKFFDASKGWGYITPDDGGEEIFVHRSVIRMKGFRSLHEGERVQFQYRQEKRGPAATLVTGPGNTDCKGTSLIGPFRKKRSRCNRCCNFEITMLGYFNVVLHGVLLIAIIIGLIFLLCCRWYNTFTNL